MRSLNFLEEEGENPDLKKWANVLSSFSGKYDWPISGK